MKNLITTMLNLLRLKWIRWKYVLPRLAILAVLAVALRFGLDPALKWALVTSGESSVGAKVEVADIETSLWDGQLTVKQLAIANPNSPMHNLLEAADSKLQLDTGALLHGRVVVTDGTIGGLQFDTDRETSGALAETEVSESTGPSVFDPLFDQAGQMGEAWFDQLGDRLDTDIASQLKSPQVAKDLKQRWPEQYEALQQQVKSIRTRGKEIEAKIREVKSNPLRGFKKLAQLQQDLKGLQEEVKSVQQQISALPDQAKQDQQAVLAAREHDEALLREKLKIGSLDGEGLTQTLLGQPVSEGLASALDWVRWAREQVPSNRAKEKASRSRGTNVVFTAPQPDYVVEKLALEGLAQLDGQPLQLTGSLTNWCNQPKLLPEPTQLEMRGSGAMPLDLRLVMDRRKAIDRDKLLVTIPQWAIAGTTLGKPDKFAIDMANGTANFEVELRLEGDQVAGEIQFEQKSLQLTARLKDSTNQHIASALKQSLAAVNQLQANVLLSGTLKKPKFKIESDIGTQIADGLNASLKRAFQQQSDQLLASTREKVDAQMQQLTQLREQAQQQLLSQLGEGQEFLAQAAALTGGSNSGLPGGIPQLGKSLRLDGLIKK